MQLFCKAFGDFGTNCYVLKSAAGELVIDPGQGASAWVLGLVSRPLGIFCTHGHFDHIFDVASLKKELNAPVFIHANDAFMLRAKEQYGIKIQSCEPDFALKEGSVWLPEFGTAKPVFSPNLNEPAFSEAAKGQNGVLLKFRHFAGHTPGCCMIEVGGLMFSGDFLFKGSIGRWDFEFSNAKDMLDSLKKARDLKGDFTLYPGHGESTTLAEEQANLPMWERYVRSSL